VVKGGGGLVTDEAYRMQALLLHEGVNAAQGGEHFFEAMRLYDVARLAEVEPLFGGGIVEDNVVSHEEEL
jgi:hypothetical protein